MAITKVGSTITYTAPAYQRWFSDWGVVADADFAIVDNTDQLKQLKFDCSALPTNTTTTIAVPAAGGTLTLPYADTGGFLKNWGGWTPPTLTSGTSTTPSTTTVYLSQIYIVANATLTGIKVSNGATVGTDKYIVALFDNTGAPVANSALAGTTTAGGDVYQTIPFTATYAATGPKSYWIALYVNGTTDRFRSIPAVGEYSGYAGSVTGQTFGTVAAVTAPTTFTADKGPVAFTY